MSDKGKQHLRAALAEGHKAHLVEDDQVLLQQPGLKLAETIYLLGFQELYWETQSPITTDPERPPCSGARVHWRTAGMLSHSSIRSRPMGGLSTLKSRNREGQPAKHWPSFSAYGNVLDRLSATQAQASLAFTHMGSRVRISRAHLPLARWSISGPGMGFW